MADAKISALTNLTAADAINDMIPIVDVSDTPPASGNTKRISINNILSSSPTASGALTVTGLVTAGSATITGAATVGTTLGVTGVSTFAAGTAALPALTTTGDTNTGIYYPTADAVGVTAGGAEVTRVTSTGLGIGVTPNTPLAITHSDTVSTLYPMITAQYVTGTYAGMYAVRDGAGDQRGIAWQTYKAGTGLIESLRLSSDGNLSLANGNVVMTTSGKGIDFSATTSGSGTMTSELLNDYEEGTFTATLNGSVANPTATQTATGRYTKVGRQVTVQVFFSSATTTGASGRIQILGLPFANNASVEAISNVAFYSMATFTGIPVGITLASGTSIDMYSSQSGAVYQPVNFNTGVAQSVWVSLTYTV
jgi:hypothetical protein